MNVHKRIQLGGQANDHVVVRMAAADTFGIAPVILDADARSLLNPFFDLPTAAQRISRIDGNQSRNPVGIRFEELANLLLLFVGQQLAQRIGGGAGDVQGEHPLDPHPLHIDHRLCVLLEVSLPQAVIMDVPDPQLAQLLAGGEAIVGRVESKLIGAGSVHRLFSAFQESFGIAAHHLLQLRSAQRRLEQLEHSALAGEIGRMGTEDYALHGQRRPAGIAVSGD